MNSFDHFLPSANVGIMKRPPLLTQEEGHELGAQVHGVLGLARSEQVKPLFVFVLSMEESST